MQSSKSLNNFNVIAMLILLSKSLGERNKMLHVIRVVKSGSNKSELWFDTMGNLYRIVMSPKGMQIYGMHKQKAQWIELAHVTGRQVAKATKG